MTQSDIGIVEKLKACPFCGVEIHEVPMFGSEEERVLVHEGNGCVLELCHIPKSKLAAWNTRDQIITEMVEALEEAQSELDAIKEYCDSDDTSLIWPTAERGSKAIDATLAKVRDPRGMKED